jgi:hypothetical protein
MCPWDHNPTAEQGGLFEGLKKGDRPTEGVLSMAPAEGWRDHWRQNLCVLETPLRVCQGDVVCVRAVHDDWRVWFVVRKVAKGTPAERQSAGNQCANFAGNQNVEFSENQSAECAGNWSVECAGNRSVECVGDSCVVDAGGDAVKGKEHVVNGKGCVVNGKGCGCVHECVDVEGACASPKDLGEVRLLYGGNRLRMLRDVTVQVCMYVCMYVSKYVCIHICIMYICINVCMYVHIPANQSVWTQTTDYRTYIHTYRHTYTYTYMNTYTHTCRKHIKMRCEKSSIHNLSAWI